MLLLILLISFACTFIYFAKSVTESSVSSTTVPHIDIEADSLNTEAMKKEQEYVLKIALKVVVGRI